MATSFERVMVVSKREEAISRCKWLVSYRTNHLALLALLATATRTGEIEASGDLLSINNPER